MLHKALTRVIGAIGTADFHGITAQALCRALGFELSAMVFHRGRRAQPLFHDFARVGCTRGIEAYAAVTHAVNPMLRAAPGSGAVRARDFAVRDADRLPDADALIWTDEEELGFRTPGWPERQEEIGLYFPALGGMVELSLYRERGRIAAADAHLSALGALGGPLAAAFERHAALGGAGLSEADGLSARERDVHGLLVRGCSSEAIALRLGISRHTVKDHRKRVFRKLGVGSLAELLARHWAPSRHPSPEGLLPPRTTEY